MDNEMSVQLKNARLFAQDLDTPVFIVDADGNVIFYNEPAGKILGRRFDDADPVAASTWTRIFMPSNESGAPLMPEELPLMIALQESRPDYGTMWIEGIDNVRRHIGVTALPITEKSGNLIGAMAIYWEI